MRVRSIEIILIAILVVLVTGCMTNSPSEVGKRAVEIKTVVHIAAKPTHGEWQGKKKSKNVNKDDYLKKKAAYLDNPNPGKLNAMLKAREKYQESAVDCRVYRERLKKN